MKKFPLGAVAAALMIPAIGLAQVTAAQPVPAVELIPRAALFGNPEKAQARISPDGRHISFIAPRDGVLNVWLAERGKLDAAKPITHDQKRGIRQHYWAYDNKHVLFLQDNDGDENYHVYAVDIAIGTQKDLTPYQNVRAELIDLSWKKPGTAGIALNDREAEWHDVYAVDIASGERTLIEKNTGQMSSYLLDLDLQPKLAQQNNAEGSEIFRRASPPGAATISRAHDASSIPPALRVLLG